MTLIYTHIPQAAGTTLASIIERNYPAAGIFSLDRKPGTTAQDLKNLSPEEKGRIQIIKGHCPFGLHEHVPGPAKYFTILREPVERMISHYHYVLRTPEHYLHEEVSSRNLTLEQYVSSSLSTELDNGQVRILSGCGRNVPFGQCDRGFLAQAKANLEKHYVVAGLAEAFDETLMLLRGTFGWQQIDYTRKNVGEKNGTDVNPPAEAPQAIRSLNQLDCELYMFAKQLFQQQLAAHASPECLAAELAEFRSHNQSDDVRAVTSR